MPATRQSCSIEWETGDTGQEAGGEQENNQQSVHGEVINTTALAIQHMLLSYIPCTCYHGLALSTTGCCHAQPSRQIMEQMVVSFVADFILQIVHKQIVLLVPINDKI